MSLASTTSRNNYIGNGAVHIYNYTFKIFEESDLKVVVVDPVSLAQTDLTLTTHYTVTGVGDVGGGSISLVAGAFDWLDVGNDLDTGWILAVLRNLPLDQPTDIRNQGIFYPEIHENVFDRLTMQNQQQQDSIERSLKLPTSVDPADFDTNFPAEIVGQANVAIITNAAGDGFEAGPTADEITQAQAYAVAAAASAADATASAFAADSSANDAQSSEDDAEASQIAAAASAVLSQEWAVSPGLVAATDFSSKYYAAAAAASAASVGFSLAANNTWTGTNTYQNFIQYQLVVDSSTTGTATALALTKIITVLTNASLVSIDTITTAVSGKIAIIRNSTGNSITIINEGSGTAANRVITGTANNLTVLNGASIWLFYDSNTSRWAVIVGSGAGGSSTESTQAALTGGGTITVSTSVTDQVIVVGAASAITLSANPFSSTPTNLTDVTLIGNSDTNTVSIINDDSSGGCVGNFETVVLGKNQVARFRYVASLSRWVYVQ